jgi:hypothetical protein
MDVARPQLHRLGDDQVHKLHHRGVRLVFVGRGGLLLEGCLGKVDRGVGKLLKHRVGALAVGEAVVAVDRLHDLLARGDRHLDLAVEDEAELLLGVNVGGVAGGDPERAPRLSQGEDGVFAGHALGQQADHILRHLGGGEVHKLEAIGLGEGLHHLLTRRVAEPHHLVMNLLARRAGDPHGLGELLGRHNPLGHEQGGESIHETGVG